MPAKPTKSAARKPAATANPSAPAKGAGAATAPPDSPTGTPPAPAPESAAPAPAAKKAAALDLIGEKPKRVRNRAAKEAAAAAAAAEAAPPPPPPKKEVLSLIEDDPKPKTRRRAEGAGNIIPPISRVLQKQEQPAAVPVPEPAPAEPPAAEDTGDAAPAGDAVPEDDDSRIVSIKPPIIVQELAERMGLKIFQIIKDLMAMDIFANPNISIEPDVAAKLCEKHGFVFERERREKGAGVHKVEEVIEAPPPPVEEKEDELKPRPPIITFMGHVDHGKTSLIDAIRKSHVAPGEAGGITQHIAAYSVTHNGGTITILDTPGHAAFTAMRARGANVTDIVILVVAADDGIMPQTREAIAHAKAAGVKIVVALNKCDLAGANPDRVKGQLQEEGLTPEDWGGDTICVEVSATKGTGIDTLLESALLEAELLELRANPKAPCRAMVIESRVEAGKGPTATLIPQTGTLRAGTAFICGPFHGKVRGMLDDRGKPVKQAGPAIPVEVIGFSALPNVGDELVEMESDRDAKRLSDERQEERRVEKLSAPRRASLEALFAGMDGRQKALKLILKTDVQGSQEAIVSQLGEIKSDKVRLEFVLAGVGPVSENDILLASASDAVILGFNTKVEGKAVKTARAEGVQVKLYSIIYELVDQVKEAMLGLLAPETREKVLGHAQVKQVFRIQRGRVGGCVVTDGRILRSARARVLRGNQPVYDGGFQTLRRFQDDVNEVRNGLECGIRLGDFNEYEAGDIIECYELEKIAQTL